METPIELDSILTTTKKLLGIQEDYVHFDADIIILINMSFLTLHQIGLGPTTGFAIRDKTSKWEEFINDPFLTEAIKTYIYLKVRLIFDPSGTSYVLSAMQAQVKELEWRFSVQASINRMEEEINGG